MRRVLVCLACALVGCGVKFGDGGSSGGAIAKTDAGASGDAAADAQSGVACGRDAVTGAILCSGVTVCPGLFVDPDVMPDCGFAFGSLEVKCLCPGDLLCSAGKPKTCAEAKTILQGATALGVCAQVADGTCKPAR